MAHIVLVILLYVYGQIQKPTLIISALPVVMHILIVCRFIENQGRTREVRLVRVFEQYPEIFSQFVYLMLNVYHELPLIL